MTNEIFNALIDAGFKSRGGDYTGFDIRLFGDVWLCLWIQNSDLTVMLHDANDEVGIYINSLQSDDVSIEDIYKVITLKNVLRDKAIEVV